MTELRDTRPRRGGFDRGFDGHSRRQARLGLLLTPAERLLWLEQTMDELRSIVGKARYGRPIDEAHGDHPVGPARTP